MIYVTCSMNSSKSEKISDNLGEIWQLKKECSLFISYYLIITESSKLDIKGQVKLSL
jgi:hypothetical protein